jgi:hypothetical protein
LNIKLINDGSKSLSVIVNSEAVQKLKLHIYNTLGQSVDTQNIEIQQGFNNISVNLNNVELGLYYVSVSNGKEKLISKKIMITNSGN